MSGSNCRRGKGSLWPLNKTKLQPFGSLFFVFVACLIFYQASIFGFLVLPSISLLNFINFGVLAGWIGTIIMANALTTSKQSVIVFLVTVLASLLVTDILKISLAKKLQHKMTPRFIFKTKKWVSVLIIGFGLFLAYQGFFLKQSKTDTLQDRLENIKEKLPE